MVKYGIFKLIKETALTVFAYIATTTESSS